MNAAADELTHNQLGVAATRHDLAISCVWGLPGEGRGYGVSQSDTLDEVKTTC